MDDSPNFEVLPTFEVFHEFRKRYEAATELAESYLSSAIGDAYWDHMSNYLLNATSIIQCNFEQNLLKQAHLETKVENKCDDPPYNCYW